VEGVAPQLTGSKIYYRIERASTTNPGNPATTVKIYYRIERTTSRSIAPKDLYTEDLL